MPTILSIAGSPSPTSRTARLTTLVDDLLRAEGFTVERLNVRDLPAEDLLHARMDAQAIREAMQRLENADGVVVATPIYKAAYSGILKAFLDLLPQFGLTGKTVLPLATGGSLAHVLAIDYALRPMLSSLNPRNIVAGLFVLDKMIETDAEGATKLDGDILPRLKTVLDDFARALRA